MKTFSIEDMHIKLESILGVFIFHLKIYMKPISNFHHIWYPIHIYTLYMYYENTGNVILNLPHLKV